MSHTLLPTKLLIPHTRPEIVTRSRLIEQLNNGLHRPLTLISAPAGFGKTTLVTEWVESLRLDKQGAAKVHIAWLSLDESDNDYNRFLSYFFNAITQLESLDTNRGRIVQEILQSPNPAPIETIFSPIISDLTKSSKKIVLVLDDYHLIEDLRIHNALNFWLENVPPQIHTVVITREDPPFPLPRLRARNHLTELRASDLRFIEIEVPQFLNEIMGLRLDAESITLLEERTEGWVAGLQMAALSMRDRKDISTFITNFSGTNRYILDYLLEEVLSNQPSEIQRFLLHTSILKRLSSSLCDAILEGESQSTSILGYIEQANLFLIPLDDDRNWYRYHHLFSDLLRARLQQTHTDRELSGLHMRAAQWHEEKGMAYGAIYHASLIPDDEWVERIIDQNYMEIFQRRDSASIRYWTGELGKELIFKRPQLAIHEANSRAWFGQLDEADHLLDDAENRLKKEEPTPEIQAMFGYLAYVKSRVTAMRGDFAQAIQLCHSAIEKTPTSNEGLLGGIGVMLGYGYFLNGEFSHAIQILQQTIQSGKKSGAINTTIGAYCVLARLYAIQGHLQKSYALYQEAENFIHQSEGEHRGAMSIVDVGYAEILYEWNNLESASTHIQQGLEFIPLWSKADDIALAHIIHSQIQLAQANTPAAEKDIEIGSQVIRSSGVFLEARDAVTTAEIKLWLRQKDSIAINRLIKSVEDRLTLGRPSQFENELLLITLAKVYLAQNNFDDAIELLAQLEASSQEGGRAGRLIIILILQALAKNAKGEKEEALSIIEIALALAEPEGYVRTFIDEGQPIKELLSQWLSRNGRGPLNAYASQLIAQFNDNSLSALNGEEKTYFEDELIEPLSPREIEVLSLIALGKTNKEISVELVISPGTVKAHTSSIYRKLDVANRTEAVARVRELDVLS